MRREGRMRLSEKGLNENAPCYAETQLASGRGSCDCSLDRMVYWPYFDPWYSEYEVSELRDLSSPRLSLSKVGGRSENVH